MNFHTTLEKHHRKSLNFRTGTFMNLHQKNYTTQFEVHLYLFFVFCSFKIYPFRWISRNGIKVKIQLNLLSILIIIVSHHAERDTNFSFELQILNLSHFDTFHKRFNRLST